MNGRIEGKAVGAPEIQKRPNLVSLLDAIEERMQVIRHQHNRIDNGIRRLMNPHPTPVEDAATVAEPGRVEVIEARMERILRELDRMGADIAQSATDLEVMV